MQKVGINPRGIPRNAVSLASDKLEGLAQKEKAAALRDFSEAEERKIDAKLKERSLESKVRREEAEARLAEIRVLEAEVQLFVRLKDAGVVLHRDENGVYSVLPTPQDCDLDLLVRQRALPPQDEGSPKA